MLYICCWKGLRWIVEQPEGTAFPLLPRWQEFLKVAQAAHLYFLGCLNFVGCLITKDIEQNFAKHSL